MRLFSSFGQNNSATFQIHLGDSSPDNPLASSPSPVHPGGVLKGRVFLNLFRPTKTLSVILNFEGKVCTTSDKKTEEVILFKDHLVLWGTERGLNMARSTVSEKNFIPKTMDAGSHIFSFTFPVPYGLPTSMIDRDIPYGSIQYTLSAIHTKPLSILGGGTSLKSMVYVEVVELIDVRAERYCRPKGQKFDIEIKAEKEVKIGEGRTLKKGEGGIVKTGTEIPREAFLRGESIPLSINIIHVAPIKQIDGAEISLIRIASFKYRNLEKRYRTLIQKVHASILCDPTTLATTIHKSISVPTNIQPTIGNGRLVAIAYHLEVMLDLSMDVTVFDGSAKRKKKKGGGDLDKRAIKRGVVFEIPIIIGTMDSLVATPVNNDPSSNHRPSIIRIASASQIIPVLRTCTVESISSGCDDSLMAPLHTAPSSTLQPQSPIFMHPSPTPSPTPSPSPSQPGPRSASSASVLPSAPLLPPTIEGQEHFSQTPREEWRGRLTAPSQPPRPAVTNVDIFQMSDSQTLGENLLSHRYSLRRPSAPELSDINMDEVAEVPSVYITPSEKEGATLFQPEKSYKWNSQPQIPENSHAFLSSSNFSPKSSSLPATPLSSSFPSPSTSTKSLNSVSQITGRGQNTSDYDRLPKTADWEPKERKTDSIESSQYYNISGGGNGVSVRVWSEDK